jgi:hypothetical protein
MIFQNSFGSSKEVASPREPEPKSFLEKPEPCQRGPDSVVNYLSSSMVFVLNISLLHTFLVVVCRTVCSKLKLCHCSLYCIHPFDLGS